MRTDGSRWRRLPGVVLPAAVLSLLILLTVVASSAWGRAAHLNPSGASYGLFETDQPIHKTEVPEKVMRFDPSLLPSDYETPHVETRTHKYLKIVRPYEGAAFPCNLAPPEVRWEDSINDLWMVTVALPGEDRPLRVISRKKRWRFSENTWRDIRERCKGKHFTVEVRGCRAEGDRRVGEDVYLDQVQVRISEYPVDPVVVYRLVSPLFHGFKTPDIWYRNTSDFREGVFLPGKGAYCTNCHVFSPAPGSGARVSQMGIAVRDQVRQTIPRRILGLYDFRTRQGRTLNINSFFMGWSPDGSKVAVTHGEVVLVRAPITLETQQFYVQVADIYIVDTSSLTVRPLPGASEAESMENFPTWSADGKTIIFSKAEEIPTTAVAVPGRKFDLYQVPYNDGKGGKPIPIKGASFNDKSDFAARYSPDGRWIAFNQAESASLVEPTADLYILPADAQDAFPRKLECNVDNAMDSHHSWSSNSRWLLFATKRDDGIFARIYLTEIDEQGRASPPVALPLAEEPMMCFNVPEFLAYSGRIDSESILEEITKETVSPYAPVGSRTRP